MIRCPGCGHREFVGTIFCTECGTRLVHLSSAPTIDVDRKSLNHAVITKPTTPDGPLLDAGAVIGLREIETGDILSLIGRISFTLGRAKNTQAILPDVDLTEYNAYDSGVSRIHAELQISDNNIYIIDLDSSNGTLINGRFIEAQRPFPVRHGDVIQLGRLRLQLISRFR